MKLHKTQERVLALARQHRTITGADLIRFGVAKGSVYTTLHRLEKIGYLQRKKGFSDSHVYYSLSDLGAEALSAHENLSQMQLTLESQ